MMESLSQKQKEILMKMDTEGLSSTQVRLIKSIHALVANVLASDDEAEYFETSSMLMKKTAELIKHANFAVENQNMDYGDQAVEFSVDTLNETIDAKQVHNLDN